MNVRIKDGSRIKSRDARAVNSELERIRAKNGGVLEDRAVWTNSKSRSAVLHDEFTWDDSEAAALYRDREARCIIEAIVIDSGEEQGPRAWHHVIVSDRSQYAPIQEVVSSPNLMVQVLSQIQTDLRAAATRLERFKQYTAEARTIRQVAERIQPRA